MGPSPRLPSQGRERERIRSASRDSRDSRPDPRRSLDRYSRDWHDTRNRRREILDLKIGSLLLMVQKSGLHQLRLVVYPIIYRVSYISGGAGFLPTVGSMGPTVYLPT